MRTLSQPRVIAARALTQFAQLPAQQVQGQYVTAMYVARIKEGTDPVVVGSAMEPDCSTLANAYAMLTSKAAVV